MHLLIIVWQYLLTAYNKFRSRVHQYWISGSSVSQKKPSKGDEVGNGPEQRSHLRWDFGVRIIGDDWVSGSAAPSSARRLFRWIEWSWRWRHYYRGGWRRRVTEGVERRRRRRVAWVARWVSGVCGEGKEGGGIRKSRCTVRGYCTSEPALELCHHPSPRPQPRKSPGERVPMEGAACRDAGWNAAGWGKPRSTRWE